MYKSSFCTKSVKNLYHLMLIWRIAVYLLFKINRKVFKFLKYFIQIYITLNYLIYKFSRYILKVLCLYKLDIFYKSTLILIVFFVNLFVIGKL